MKRRKANKQILLCLIIQFTSELLGSMGKAIVTILKLDRTDFKAKCNIRDRDISQL